MLIQIINKNAEKKCIEFLETPERGLANRNLLQCRFSDINLHPEPDELLLIVKDIIADMEASLLFCSDGDVFIRWGGHPQITNKYLIRCISTAYGDLIPEHLSKVFFKYYDFQVHAEDIRLECRGKLQKIHQLLEKQKAELVKREKKIIEKLTVTDFSAQLLETLHNSLQERNKRAVLKILIVGDQALGSKYQCCTAEDGSGAITQYALHAPDIVFLDIELPDIDGHTLAEKFGQVDSHAYIVMVTGNNYAADVAKARQNQVKGFIIKPYNKKSIIDSVNRFIQQRKA